LRMINVPREVVNDVTIENQVSLQVIESDEKKKYEYFHRLHQALEEAKIKDWGINVFYLKDYKPHQAKDGASKGRFPAFRVEVNPKIESIKDLMIVFPQSKGEVPFSHLVHSKPAFSGEHAKEGILIMRGKGLRRGYKISRASVLDVTPTILALKGVSLGGDMDGRALKEIMDPVFLTKHPISYVHSYSLYPLPTTEETVKLDNETLQRLKALGYIQ